jgi:hypothetical protein
MSQFQDFIHHFSQGVMKVARFEVEFNPPFTASSKTINIKCHTATFPARMMQSAESRTNTAPRRHASGFANDPVTFSFYANAGGDTRRWFETWNERSFNVATMSAEYYANYVGSIKMYSLDEAGQRRYGVELLEAWPASIGSMDVSYGNSNHAQTVTVTMTYKNWNNLKVGTGLFPS